MGGFFFLVFCSQQDDASIYMYTSVDKGEILSARSSSSSSSSITAGKGNCGAVLEKNGRSMVSLRPCLSLDYAELIQTSSSLALRFAVPQ